MCPEKVEVLETDTSPEETLRILLGSRRKEQADSSGTLDLDKRASQSDDELRVSEYCAMKLLFFNEMDLTKYVNFDKDSIIEILGEGYLRMRVAAEEGNVTETFSELRWYLAVSCWKRVKCFKVGGLKSLMLGMISVRTPMKRTSKVVFAVDEHDNDYLERVRAALFNELDQRITCRTVTLAEGASTDIGLSQSDAMIRQGTSALQVGHLGLLRET